MVYVDIEFGLWTDLRPLEVESLKPLNGIDAWISWCSFHRETKIWNFYEHAIAIRRSYRSDGEC